MDLIIIYSVFVLLVLLIGLGYYSNRDNQETLELFSNNENNDATLMVNGLNISNDTVNGRMIDGVSKLLGYWVVLSFQI